MTTHDIDIDIELPEHWQAFQYNEGWNTWEQVIPSEANEPRAVKAYTADQVRAAIEADQKRRGEPVAWRVHPFDYGVGYEGAYALTSRLDQVAAWERKGWKVQPLFTAPQPADPDTIRELLTELDAANARLHDVATLCATVEQERDSLLRACRVAILALAHAETEKPGMYQEAYDVVDQAIRDAAMEGEK